MPSGVILTVGILNNVIPAAGCFLVIPTERSEWRNLYVKDLSDLSASLEMTRGSAGSG